MIRLLRVQYTEPAARIVEKLALHIDGSMDLEDYPGHTPFGTILDVAHELQEYSWEPASGDCVYLITQGTQWDLFVSALLVPAGIGYTVEDCLDQYYAGHLRLPRLRKRIERYLRYWLTTDEVLDKMNAHGAGSLTATDRAVLHAASQGTQPPMDI